MEARGWKYWIPSPPDRHLSGYNVKGFRRVPFTVLHHRPTRFLDKFLSVLEALFVSKMKVTTHMYADDMKVNFRCKLEDLNAGTAVLSIFFVTIKIKKLAG